MRRSEKVSRISEQPSYISNKKYFGNNSSSFGFVVEVECDGLFTKYCKGIFFFENAKELRCNLSKYNWRFMEYDKKTPSFHYTFFSSGRKVLTECGFSYFVN